jgi:hypothetical protein
MPTAQVAASFGFQELLRTVLVIGSLLNDTCEVPLTGFTVDSLTKLSAVCTAAGASVLAGVCVGHAVHSKPCARGRQSPVCLWGGGRLFLVRRPGRSASG